MNYDYHTSIVARLLTKLIQLSPCSMYAVNNRFYEVYQPVLQSLSGLQMDSTATLSIELQKQRADFSFKASSSRNEENINLSRYFMVVG